MERKDARVDTEESVPTQNLHVPILEVEGIMGGYYRGVDGRLIRRRICNCEVRQTGDADGRRLGDGGSGGRFSLWGSDRFKWRGPRNLWFNVRIG